jgi:4'-phosphopantetheinyl transferase
LPDLNVSYCLTGTLDEDAISAAVNQLSPEERARHARFRFARDRRDFAVAHALLRRALSAQFQLPPADWSFVAGTNGKPQLEPDLAARTHLTFNLAHTDGLVACVVTRDAHDVGIDVEAIDRRTDALELARRHFSPFEIADLQQCPADSRQTRFIEVWTLKEAYVKAIGDGLSCPLDTFGFVFDGPSSLRFRSADAAESASWRFGLFAPSDRHRLAVAVRDPSGSARPHLARFDGVTVPPAIVSSPALRASW